MNCGARIALGLAGGYLLGRKKNGRMLLLLGAALASRNFAGAAARRSADSLNSSPEVAKLVDTGREALVAALSSRIGTLTDQLHSRTEALRHPDTPDGGEPEEPDEPEEPEAAADEDEDEDEEAEADEEESDSEPASRRRRRGSPTRQRAAQPPRRASQSRRRAPAGQSRR